MLRDKIVEFQKKFPKFDLTEFIIEFENGTSRVELEKMFECTELPLRTFVYSLGLDFVKSKRMASVENFKYRLGLEDGETLDSVKELADDVVTLAEKNRKLYKSLTLARDENNNLRKEIREEARVEELIMTLCEGIGKELTTTPALRVLNLPEPVYTKEKPFVLISDVHANEIIEGRFIEDTNEYNFDILGEGLQRHFRSMLSQTGEVAYVFNASDLLSGKIHSLDLVGEFPVTESIVKLAVELSAIYKALAERYNKVIIENITGNHSRLTDKPSMRQKAFDFEHLLFELIKQMCTGINNLDLRYSHSTVSMTNVADEGLPEKYVGMVHGDSFKVTGDAAILKTITMFEQTFNKKASHVFSGHTHKMSITHTPSGGYNIVNGCYSGTSEYGFASGFNPIHTFQITGSFNEFGDIVSISPINVRG